ncbi:hypothetical protein LNV54_20190, partial [Klebsiella pneumoniae]|nr:hypothetical protein [Klebsiella pneumoniae]
AHDVPLGCAPDEYDDLISGTCSHLPKYWDYLSSRNIETGTNQDANDKALAVMPGRTWQLGVNVDF